MKIAICTKNKAFGQTVGNRLVETMDAEIVLTNDFTKADYDIVVIEEGTKPILGKDTPRMTFILKSNGQMMAFDFRQLLN